MSHKFSKDFSKLESQERKRILPAKDILRKIGIKKGCTIIDFGCGIGYFSLPAAEFVGDSGKVIAIDISDEMIGELKDRAVGINNIKIIKSDKIVGVKGDIILLVNILHELDNPNKFLKGCFSVLNPKGIVVIIDWQKKETNMGPPIHHRISREEIIAITNKEFIEHDIDKSLYFLEFRL